MSTSSLEADMSTSCTFFFCTPLAGLDGMHVCRPDLSCCMTMYVSHGMTYRSAGVAKAPRKRLHTLRQGPQTGSSWELLQVCTVTSDKQACTHAGSARGLVDCKLPPICNVTSGPSIGYLGRGRRCRSTKVAQSPF